MTQITPEELIIAKTMKESTLEENVRQLCLSLRILRYHTYRSTRSAPGFPDDVIVGNWVMFREIKSERGKLSPSQAEWIARLAAVGADVGIWRPSDWMNGKIITELKACAQGSVSGAPTGDFPG